MTNEEPRTYIARQPAQHRALSSPIRLEILGQFTWPDEMSISEVARRMGRPASSLYYHFGILEKVGLLRRVGERPRVKRAEAVFKPVASRIAIPASLGTRSSIRASLKAMRSAFRMAERDLEAVLKSGKASLAGQRPSFFAARMHFRITKKTLAEINKHLEAIDKILDREGRRKKLPPDADQYCSLTLALLPLRGRGQDTKPTGDRKE